MKIRAHKINRNKKVNNKIKKYIKMKDYKNKFIKKINNKMMSKINKFKIKNKEIKMKEEKVNKSLLKQLIYLNKLKKLQTVIKLQLIANISKKKMRMNKFLLQILLMLILLKKDLLLNLKVELFMKESGKDRLEKDMEYKNGQIMQNMKVFFYKIVIYYKFYS